MMKLFKLYFMVAIIVTVRSNENCSLSQSLRDEIAAYDPVVKKIVNYVLEGPYKNKTYIELAEWVDEFGPRMSGSVVLENSIDYLINKSRDLGLDVYTENVEVPHWVRGEESAAMLQPRPQKLDILGLGCSVITPPEGITAEAIVVSSFDELDALSNEEITGKIVVYNQPYTYYGGSAKYRRLGASVASSKGAVAALIRSVTQFSLGTPHTGMQNYDDKSKHIPVASITAEDAELLQRIHRRGKKIVINLKLSSTSSRAVSRNTLIDINGAEKPEQVVIVSGHVDSWDVGQGALDDGGGLFASWAVPRILTKLNLKPKRTLRTIFWTAEEFDMRGAKTYLEKHKNDLDNINFVLESDEGTFRPTGLEVAAVHQTHCIVEEILKLFKFINASSIRKGETPGSDIIPFLKLGIPGAGLLNENEKYFWFHHSSGDSINVLDPHSLDLAAAFWTAVSYMIADVSVDMPRK